MDYAAWHDLAIQRGLLTIEELSRPNLRPGHAGVHEGEDEAVEEQGDDHLEVYRHLQQRAVLEEEIPPLGMPYPTVITVSREKAKAPWKDMGSPAGPSTQLISLASFKSTHAVLSKARLGGVRNSRCAAGGRRGTLSWKCRFFRCRPQLVLTTWCRVFPTRRPDTAVVSATSCDVGFFFSVSYVVSLPNCRHVVVVSTTKYLTPCVFDLLYPSSSSQHNHHNYSANFPPAPAAAI